MGLPLNCIHCSRVYKRFWLRYMCKVDDFGVILLIALYNVIKQTI